MYAKASFLVLLFYFSIFLLIFTCFPNPGTATIQPLLVNSSPPATIPAYPEESNVAGCPLDLSDELFHAVKSACGNNAFKNNETSAELRRSRCCPVLATWLYSAYSATALGSRGRVTPAVPGHTPTSEDLPLLPDDSETCVDGLGKALKRRGIELTKPNETCDVVYCYCGIRLHPLSCPEPFSMNPTGKLVGDESVKRLEKDCLSSNSNVNGFPGLGGCNKCLNSLQELNKKPSNSSKSQDRTMRMRNKDCQLMGLTWLLAKNRTAYIHTVSSVIRAMMMSRNGAEPQSCTLSSDGMPLAVDSSDISNKSSSTTLPVPISLSFVSLCLLFMLSIVSSAWF